MTAHPMEIFANRRELDAAQRQDFGCFLYAAFSAVYPRTVLQPNWHIDAVVHKLHRVKDGELRRLIINQPPRSLKSLTISVAYVAWRIGLDPSLQVIVVSYNRAFAVELHRQFRMVVKSDAYRRLFPWVEWARETDTDFVTTEGGGRFATSIGGQLTGRGGDLIIVDDPLNAADANSEPARRSNIEFFGQSLLSRENDKNRGAVIVVMQRLHEQDLTGHLLEQGGWDHLLLPAMAVEESSVALTLGGFKHRRVGEALHPARENAETLQRLEKDMGSLKFAAQYQQAPMPIEGNIVKRAHLLFYDVLPTREAGDEVVISVDPAASVGPANDYSVCTTWMVRKKQVYLMEVWRGRVILPDLRRRIAELAQRHGANRILIEEAGVGLPFVQDLRVNPLPGAPLPVGLKPDGSKIDRMVVQAARFEDGTVLLPREAPWLPTYLAEILSFPLARHDDQVDSTSQFLRWHSSYRQVFELPLPIIVIGPPRYDPFSPPPGW